MKLIALPLIVSSLVLLASCSRQVSDSGADEAAITPVELATAQRKSIANVITSEAVLFPLRQAIIVPKISAPVQRFLVQRGDHVRAGQLVAVLEGRDLAASAQESKQMYQQAEASYQITAGATLPDNLTRAKNDAKAAEEALDAAQSVYKSREKLYQQGAIAQRLVEDAKVAFVQAQTASETAQQNLHSLLSGGQSAQLKNAEAQVAAAKAHFQSSDAQLSYTQVRSPISGVVADRPLNIGEMASSGTSLLTVIDISRVVARSNVPVNVASEMRAGQQAQITDGKVMLPGKVTVVSPAVDSNTTTVQIWVEAANPGEKLKLGSTVQVSIEAGEDKNAVVVPASAILSTGEGGEKVMVVTSDSRAHDRPVQVGIRTAEEAEITDGLNGGEQVITSGALGLDDGAKVKIGQPSADDEDKSPGKSGGQ